MHLVEQWQAFNQCVTNTLLATEAECDEVEAEEDLVVLEGGFLRVCPIQPHFLRGFVLQLVLVS